MSADKAYLEGVYAALAYACRILDESKDLEDARERIRELGQMAVASLTEVLEEEFRERLLITG